MKANYKGKYIDSLLKSKAGRIATLEQCYETLDDYESLVLYALNKDFGWGHDRLKRLYDIMQKIRDDLREFYCADETGDKKIDFYVIKEELKRKGIAPEQLEEGLNG